MIEHPIQLLEHKQLILYTKQTEHQTGYPI